MSALINLLVGSLSFGKKHLFDKQEVVSRGVGRTNDRIKWHNKGLLAPVSLEGQTWFQCQETVSPIA